MFNLTLRVSLASLSFVVTSALASTGWATTITSAPFSLGYGIPSAGGWSTSETSGSNTATTIGDFDFIPTLSGIHSSSGGPTFPGRVLTDGAAALTDYVGAASSFNVDLAGAYNGTLPDNASSVEIRINVDNVSGYFVHRSFFGSDNDGAGFIETTVGHGASSSLTGGIASLAGGGTGLDLASNYTLAAWNPGDYATSGLSFIRSFEVGATDTAQYALDGFEITGTVEVSYEVVPEPSSVVLISLGLVAMMRRRKRRRD